MIEKKEIRTFGRIRGRNLNKNRLDQYNNDLLKYKIDEKNLDIFTQNYKKIFFEIGFGYGENTIQQAINNKDVGIIASEPYINGVLSLIKKIKENNINNIKIYNNDARILIKSLKNNSIDTFFLLFPDPWPKKRQNKRRIINEVFIDLIKTKLKLNGTFFFATDMLDYAEWTYNYTKNKLIPNFTNYLTSDKEPNWWTRTKYQQKAINENRKCYFLEFKNI